MIRFTHAVVASLLVSNHANAQNTIPEELIAKAESGEAQAQVDLGDLWSGLKVRGREALDLKTFRRLLDEEKAVGWWRKAAEQGLPLAQYRLGAHCQGYKPVEGYHRHDALGWYEKAAKQGHDLSCYKLGEMYRNGTYGGGLLASKPDYGKAVFWWTKASNHGHAQSTYELMKCFFSDQHGLRKDLAKAEELRRLAAKQGWADAQFDLFQKYASGDGVERSDANAQRWLRKSAEQGHEHAAYQLGMWTSQGRSLPKSDKEAAKWFSIAAGSMYYLTKEYHAEFNLVNRDALKWLQIHAEAGDPDIQYTLACWYFKCTLVGETGVDYADFKMGLQDKWLRRAADQQHLTAMSKIGDRYLSGDFLGDGGVVYPQDVEKGIDMLTRCAGRGDYDAAYSLGLHYGVREALSPDNREKSIRWYVRAMELASTRSERLDVAEYLAPAYQSGEGVPKNARKAFELYRLLADSGNAKAIVKLALCYQAGYGVLEDDQKAIELLESAVAKSGGRAEFYLGCAHSDGEGVPQDFEQAYSWWLKSARKGIAEAQGNVAICHAEGLGIAASDIRAYAWASIAHAGGLSSASDVKDKSKAAMTPANVLEAQRLSRRLMDQIGAGNER